MDLRRTTDRFHGEKLCNLTTEELAEFLEAVAARGAYTALKRVGLGDETAHQDVRDLRGLLQGWRVTKRATWARVRDIIVTAAVIYLLTAFSGKPISFVQAALRGVTQ